MFGTRSLNLLKFDGLSDLCKMNIFFLLSFPQKRESIKDKMCLNSFTVSVRKKGRFNE